MLEIGQRKAWPVWPEFDAKCGKTANHLSPNINMDVLPSDLYIGTSCENLIKHQDSWSFLLFSLPLCLTK